MLACDWSSDVCSSDLLSSEVHKILFVQRSAMTEHTHTHSEFQWERTAQVHDCQDMGPIGAILETGYNSFNLSILICCCSVTQLCLTLHNPMYCSMPGFPVLYYLPEFAQLMSVESMMPSNHHILCHPLFLLPSVFPSIKVFVNDSVLHIRWPKYWSFNFSPSNEY